MTKRSTNQAQVAPKTSSSGKLILGMLGIAAVLFGIWYLSQQNPASSSGIEFRHIHGLSYSADGSQLFAPAHDGLLVYANGRWSVPDLPIHDYMGYAGVNDGFYSSGHPGPNSTLVNPLGLIHSTDGGLSFQTLAFSGESDFHQMAVGYVNHTIYVLNPANNSRLGTGLYYSLDDAQSWQESGAAGISSSPIQIAVHPMEANQVALATETGLFLSRDYGQSFTQIVQTAPVTAVSFDPDGSRLLFGYQSLQDYNLETGAITALQTPPLAAEDAISNIAINPVNDEIAFASFNKDIYLSEDNGLAWQPIAQAGIGQD